MNKATSLQMWSASVPLPKHSEGFVLMCFESEARGSSRKYNRHQRWSDQLTRNANAQTNSVLRERLFEARALLSWKAFMEATGRLLLVLAVLLNLLLICIF